MRSQSKETFTSWNIAASLMNAVRKVFQSKQPSTQMGTVEFSGRRAVYLISSSTLPVKKRTPQPGDTYCVYRILISDGPSHASGKICVLCKRPCWDPFFIETTPGVTYVVYKVSDDCDQCDEADTYELDEGRL